MAAASSPFTAVTAMGALIAPAQFAKIAAATLPGQDADSYGVPKGLTLRDELARYFRIGQAQWRTFSAAPNPTLGATARYLEGLLRDVLGFADVARLSDAVEVGGRNFPLALMAGAVPVAVAPAADAIDRPSDSLSAPGRRRSVATLMQEYLNADTAALWGLASNGRCLRLVRDNPSLTRPAFIEFDLGAIFDDEAYADFAALFLTLHRSRFATNEGSCPLEFWRQEGAKAGAVARDKLRDGVEAALGLLGQGFLEHPANTALAERLRCGALSLGDYYAALLRLVYRLIFLLAAEDRGLLHPTDAPPAPRQLYARGYAVGRLRDRAVLRAAWDRHHDAWEGLCIVMDALGGGETRLGLPALGGLFDPETLAEFMGAQLSNAKLLEAIYRLAWLREASGPVPVNWRDMESEELGSVYEGLLELVPRLERGGTRFAFAVEGVETKGNARKVSSSYYTPDTLVQALLDSALNPILDAAVSAADDPAAALLGLRVIDPACGSGHFLLSAARRIAARLASVRANGSPAPDDYRHALREVVGACIHGVDRNPMAVELTKVALWIESVEPGKPLGLLDANIRCGDALLGLSNLSVLENGIPDDAYAPLAGDDKATAREQRNINRAERDRPLLSSILRPKRLANEAARILGMPEDTIALVGAKRRALAAFMASDERSSLLRAADAWVAAFLAPKLPGALVPTTRSVWEAMSSELRRSDLGDEVKLLAGSARAFHWPLEFPAALAGDDPGFDLVIGNPPWDVVQLSDKEYFSAIRPEIAFLTGAKRKRAIEELRNSEPQIFSGYQVARRASEAANEFARASGRFDLVAKGKINTFGLFACLSVSILNRAGSSALVLPAEILTSETHAEFIRSLVAKGTLESAFSFENEEFVFPGIANVVQFSLVTFSRNNSSVRVANYLRHVDQLGESERLMDLTAADCSLFCGEMGNLPAFRSKADLTLSRHLFRKSDRVDALGSAWDVSAKQGLFNMSSDSERFKEKSELVDNGLNLSGEMIFNGDDQIYLPLYEGKFISHFDYRFSSYHNLGKEKGRGGRGLPPVKLVEYQDSTFEILPRYWVNQEDTRRAISDLNWNYKWLLGWRDVANAKVERTVTFSAFPATAVGHTCSLLLPRHDPRLMACLYANLNALVLDYCARQIVGGTHVTSGYLKQLPVLSPSAYSVTDQDFIIPRVLELTFTSHSMVRFGQDLAYEGSPFRWSEDRRAQLRAELDAWYARAYGLTRDQLRYILDPSDVMGVGYPSETFRVLKNNEMARFAGDFRTARLTLAAWDAQERGA